MAQKWSHQQGLELSIKPLTESALGYSSSKFPTLESTIKAARTRVLFEFVCKICLDVSAPMHWASFHIVIHVFNRHAGIEIEDACERVACMSSGT